MGSVYLAATGRPGLEKLCVVKRLIPETPSSPDRVARFRREADIVRTMSLGAIAQTLAVDDFEGEPYIVQEFIQGRTLTQLLAAAPEKTAALPPTLALHVAREVARALAYAHRAGVVHRDIAPDNVMVTFDGEVRLIDFGIARAGTDASLTAPGSFVGRYAYTAPEVLQGQRADPRADIYALGILLWELLTGQAPLFSEEAPPAPSSLAKMPLPAGVDTVVAKATERNPDHRYASAQELQSALGALLAPNFVGEGALAAFVGRCYDVPLERSRIAEDVLEAQPLLANPGERRQAPSRWPLTGAVALAAVVGVAFTLAVRRRPPAPVPAPPAPVAQVPPAVAPAPPAVTAAPLATVTPPPRSVPPPAAHPAPAARRPVQPSAAVGLLLDRARDRLQLGDYAGAERDAREALGGGTSTQKSRAHLLIAKGLISRGRAREAADELAAAVELDPANAGAADQLAKLRRRGSL
jgi:serine/threonine-protein kinase